MLWARDKAKSIFKFLVDYVLPHRCMGCSVLTESSNAICGNCLQKLDFITKPYCYICGTKFTFNLQERTLCGKCIQKPPKYDIGRSLLDFNQHSKNLIHSFKYNDKTTYAKFFAKLLVQKYKEEIGHIDIVVPVPMHRIKRLFRYYNPAEILAKEISNLIQKPIIPDLLLKTKWTKSQSSLSKAKRKKNLSGSIEFNKKYNIANKSILLIDDVHTTGTTSDSCSLILKKKKALKVALFTIAKT